MIEHLLYFYLRTVLKRSWDELMLSTREPARAQESRLLDIVSRNIETDFGKQHGFSEIRSAEDFRRRVPVRSYDEIEPYIRRMRRGEKRVLTSEDPEMFCRTSGTTSEPKFIPVTPSFYEEFSKMQKMWQRKLFADYRGIARGKILSIMGPEIDGYTECGIPYGSMSGHSYRLQYPLTQRLYAVPYDVMCLSDFDAKYYLALRFALEKNVTAIAAMNPSTILLMMRKLNSNASQICRDIADGEINREIDIPPRLHRHLKQHLRPNRKRAGEIGKLAEAGRLIRATDVWKNLSAVITWQGGSASFFLGVFPEYFPAIPLRDMGLIATEGYFSIPLWSNTPNGLLAITGHFFEFFEVEPDGGRSETALGCEELERGRHYYVVVTTSGGLYRYDICDIVEVADFYNGTPVIAFRHKGGNVVSITGEKLTETQVTDAMRAATASLPVSVEGFTLVLQLGDPPFYLLTVETQEEDRGVLAELLWLFEKELRLRNIEYVAKRDSQRLGDPRLCLLSPGFFEEYRKKKVRQGTPDGQYKIPHIMPDMQQLGEIRPIAEIRMPSKQIFKGSP